MRSFAGALVGAAHACGARVAVAALLCAGVMLQLVTLTADFSEATSLRGVFAALPDVAFGTHPGHVLVWTLGVAVLLLVAAVLERMSAVAALLAACLLLRAGTGHAATEHLFSWTQTLQAVHLLGMAVWAGGVLVAGLAIAPRLMADESGYAALLSNLSETSTFGVILVAFSGIAKGYGPVSPDWHAALHSAWGVVLAVKVACVLAALALGVMNRLAVRRGAWHVAVRARGVRLLRGEAVAMVLVLLLSSVLGNLPPPGM